MEKTYVLSNLSWNAPEYKQKETMESIINDPNLDIKSLIQPGDKSCWENAAYCLQYLGYPKIEKTIEDLLLWIQDVNWPGAFTIVDLLSTVPNEVFIIYFEQAIRKAIDSDDEPWLENLSIFLFRKKVSNDDFNDHQLFLTVEQYEDQWETQ